MSKLSHDLTNQDMQDLYDLIPKCETCKHDNCDLIHCSVENHGVEFCSKHTDFEWKKK